MTCRLLLISLVCIFPLALAADQIGYAVDTSNSLYQVDLTTTATTLIAPISGVPATAFLEGLAISPLGALFATDSDGILYALNNGGAATRVADTGLGDIEGLAFLGNTLLGADFNFPGTLYSIDPSSGAATPILTTQEGPFRALTMEDSSTALAVSDSPAFQSLVSLDLVSGISDVVGPLPPVFISSLALGTDGNLYALDDSGDDYSISPATAAGVLIGNTGGQDWLDLAIPFSAPQQPTVPEPSTLVLLGGGGVCLGLFRRCRLARRMTQE